MTDKKALLIIDMQKGCFADETPKFDSENVIERINSLIRIFREAQSAIIFIQQDSSKWGRFIPKTTEWEILSDLMVKENDISSHLIHQDVLLVTGENDAFQPPILLHKQKDALVNAKSVTTRIFTKEEQADQHCQIGNLNIVLNEMYEWIERKSTC